MLARIAHELYWLGRNLARAEFTARAVEAVFRSGLQGSSDAVPGVSFGSGGLLAMLGDVEDSADGRAGLDQLTLDPARPGSMLASIERAREGARTVRDVISAEMWEAINTTSLALREGLDRPARGSTSGTSQYVKERTALIWGVANRSMLRAVGFGDADFAKPIVGIANGQSTITPCNMGLGKLADRAEAALRSAGAMPQMFGTITVSDGISMGTEGMKYSLVSREVIADAIEVAVNVVGVDRTSRRGREDEVLVLPRDPFHLQLLTARRLVHPRNPDRRPRPRRRRRHHRPGHRQDHPVRLDRDR